MKEFDVPAHLQTVKEITIRIAAKGNSTTARVFEIRVVGLYRPEICLQFFVYNPVFTLQLIFIFVLSY